MVFPSVPAFLDPPNWNQQPNYQQEAGGQVHQQPPAPPQRPDDKISGAARPSSMGDRARLAKLPQPEPGLKCPRCDSTNTKFCYFNNYSLLQPRHFCKACRRYWTRGGALRNVPVGGGCRRNRRSKSGGGSKTAVAATERQTVSFAAATSAAGLSEIPPNITTQTQQLPFLSPLQPLFDYGATAASLGLAFQGIQPLEGVDFQLGGSSSVPIEQWKLQQFPPPPAPPAMGLFPFDGEGGVGCFAGQLHGKPSSSGLISHLSSVKMEGNPRGINLPRQYLAITGDNQYWSVSGGGGGGSSNGGGSGGGGGWTDLPEFNSSSTGNIL